MRWPMAMFDTTPLGRILSRFSKDMEAVDTELPGVFEVLLSLLFSVSVQFKRVNNHTFSSTVLMRFFFYHLSSKNKGLSTIVVISVSTPLFLAVILPIGIVYYFVQRFYVATSRQLKRLESVSRSPIYSHFGESIQGAPTIRAYGVQNK